MENGRSVTFEFVKGFWPVVVILFGLGMAWANITSKIDNVIAIQKETNDVAKQMAGIVGDHATRIAVMETQMSACYSYCLSPRSAGLTTQPSSIANANQESISSHQPERDSRPTTVNVKSESKSESKAEKESEKEEEKKGLVETLTGIKL